MKPIIVILAPDNFQMPDTKNIEEHLANEYHLLCVIDPARKTTAIKVFSDVNIPPVELAALKKLCHGSTRP
jgi:hypothetical protein